MNEDVNDKSPGADEPKTDVCWLEELEKYKASEDRTSRENFVTTALGWALSDSRAARDCFLEKMFPKERFGSFSEVTLKTQEKIKWADGPGNGFLDIYIKNRRAIGAIECKVDSVPDEDQVRNYEAALKKRAEKPGREWVLSYLSPRDPVFSKNPNGRVVQWHQVFSALNNLSNERSPILREVLEFMRRIGMTPPKPMTKEALQVLSSFQTHLTSTRNLVARVADLIKQGDRNQDLRPDGGEGSRSTWYNVAQFKCDALGEDIIQPGLVWGVDNVNKLSLVVYIGGQDNNKKLTKLPRWKERHGWTNGTTYEIPVEEVAPRFCDSDFGFDQQAQALANHVSDVLDGALKHLRARN